MLSISNEQAHSFALSIAFDITEYIKNNQSSYQDWLKEQTMSDGAVTV